MIRTPTHVPAAAVAPESAVSMVATERAHSLRYAFIAVIASLVAVVAMIGWYVNGERFANNVQFIMVKSLPNGTWTVEKDMGDRLVYFDATLTQILYDFVERRYSKRSETILDDWAVSYAMYAPPMRDWFLNKFKGTEVAKEQAACPQCPQVRVRVRTHQHIDPLPTNPGVEISKPIRTLIYATEETTPASSAVAAEKVRKLYRVTWRMLDKPAIQSNRALLRYNPLGIQIIDVEVTDDTTTD